MYNVIQIRWRLKCNQYNVKCTKLRDCGWYKQTEFILQHSAFSPVLRAKQVKILPKYWHSCSFLSVLLEYWFTCYPMFNILLEHRHTCYYNFSFTLQISIYFLLYLSCTCININILLNFYFYLPPMDWKYLHTCYFIFYRVFQMYSRLTNNQTRAFCSTV